MKRPLAISSYWICQLTGWTLAGCFWMLNAYLSGSFHWTLAIAYFIPDVVIGIGITHVYRSLANRYGWIHINLPTLLRVVIPAILANGICYMELIAIKNYEVRLLLGYPLEPTFWISLRNNWLALLSTGIRLMAIWILAFHLYHYAILRIRMADERARLEVAVKQAELQNLSAQLNPHFFFNALNSIKALVAEAPDKARRAIDLLSALLRNALAQHAVEEVSLADEMHVVYDYLELEKIRFEERLCYQIDVPKELLLFRLPPLALQLLVENAVKHGIANLADGGVILIKARLTAGVLEIIVQNRGNWPEKLPDTGIGLRNLRERLELQYQGTASLSVNKLAAETISATLKLPVKV